MTNNTITLTREEAQQVLDVIERNIVGVPRYRATELLRARLAQPEPEPAAWMYEFGTDNADAVNEIRWYKNVHLTKPTGMVRNVVPLYTAPPQRKEDRVWCVCGDQIMPDDDEAMCGTCIAFGRNAPPQREGK